MSRKSKNVTFILERAFMRSEKYFYALYIGNGLMQFSGLLIKNLPNGNVQLDSVDTRFKNSLN